MMKRLTNNKQYLLIFPLLLFFSCPNDDGDTEVLPTAQEVAEELLLGSWRLAGENKITLDNRNVTANYPGLVFTFSNNTLYSTQNGADLFSSSGIWKAIDNSVTQLVLDTDLLVNLQRSNGNQIILSFNLTGNTGVAAGLAGSYRVELTKTN